MLRGNTPSIGSFLVQLARARMGTERWRAAKAVVLAALLFGIPLGVYLRTLAPTVIWRNSGADSGDLVTAVVTGGVPHPPGYPLYLLVATLFASLPLGEPARSVGLISALAAAAASTLLAYAGYANMNIRGQRAQACAVSVALTFAFAPMFWSQATIAEVYALHVLLVTALLAVSLSDSRCRLVIAAGVTGLGLAHHFSIILLAPTALLLLRDTFRTNRADAGRAIGLLIAPLSLYLTLPIRAAADPPINWGNSRTLEGFWWTVSASAYHSYFFDLSSAEMFSRVAATARLLFEQFNAWGVALALWGLAQMAANDDPQIRRRLLALGLGFLLTSAYAVAYSSRDSFLYLLPAFAIFALWMAFGLGDLASRITRSWVQVVLALALFFLPAYNLAVNFRNMDLSQDREAFNYARDVFATVPRDAVILTTGGEHLFALWYYRYVIAQDASRVTVVSTELLQFDWYYDQIRKNIPTLPDTRLSTTSYSIRLRETVEWSMAAGHPVFSTTATNWLADYAYQPVGTLYWIQSRRH